MRLKVQTVLGEAFVGSLSDRGSTPHTLIDQGLVDGKLVDVDTDDPQEGRTKVEVYVE